MDDRITTVGSSITTLQSSLSTLNTNLTGQINSVSSGSVSKTGNNTISGNNSFTGTNTFPTQAYTDSSTKTATTAFVKSAIYHNPTMPNFSQRTSWNVNGGTTPYDCLLIAYDGSTLYDGSSGLLVTVNNSLIYKARVSDYAASAGSFLCYLPKNSVVSLSWGNTTSAHVYIVPLKGVS